MQSVNAGSGLQNLGNTCFFNAVLQSLLHAPPLRPLLQSQGHGAKCQRKSEWCVFCQLQRVYKGSHSARIYSPSNMIRNLNKVFKKFRLGRQEDSHQFLRYLIEGMQDSETGKLPKDQRDECEKRIKRTNVFEVFGGSIRTVVECLGCSHKSITTERYYDFNIECQRANSLHEGVASHFAVDKLEGANKYLCEHCKVRSNARKRFQLETAPQVATFQLKRFTNSMRKIGKFIQYPYELDLGKYLQKPKKTVMKLFGVVVHLGGSSFSGHYFAFVRVGSNWFKMDDSYVTKVSQESVLNQQAYILFYERQQPHEKDKTPIQPVKLLQAVKEKSNNNPQATQKPAQKSKSLPAKSESSKMIAESPSLKPHPNGTNHQAKPDQIPQKPLQPQTKLIKLSNKAQIPGPVFQQIQSKLVSKLSKSDELRQLDVSGLISHAVKQVIQEVSPMKGKQPQPQPEEHLYTPSEESEDICLPELVRGKSKEQVEAEMPFSQLIMQTFLKIFDLNKKMAPKRPRNSSQRSMYNLRSYETKMLKKRKIG